MASSSNKEEHDEDHSSEYEKQRMSFIADLRRFNENRGTPFDRIPEIGGRQVDLYHLYQKVTGLGGRQKVNNEQQWDDFQEEFNLPRACVNSVQALKNIYFRFLNLYEKVNFLGEDPDVKNNEEEDAPARKKICLPIDSIPLCYNYNQHKLTDALRQQHSLSTDLYSQSEYEKLLMSLRSGLPNEVDLAVNVCVLLSTEGKHCIKLEKCPQLLHLLLAHVGVFEDSEEMQDLYQHCWLPYTKRNFLRFWYETVDSADVRTLITWRGKQYIQRDLIGEEVLNLGRDLGISDVEGHRVVQVAVFLHNLSFEEDNQKLLASSYLVFKFVMLSLHSTYGGLRQLALDTFANLSCELALDTVKGINCRLVLNLLNTALFSEDRFFLVRGLEILSKMSQVPSSESILVEQLREDVYKRLVDLLTVQDIQLIVHTLEALYKLSKIGEPFTTRIARVHRAIETLVSLITIEAQSFGPGSLVGIKVVEYVPPTHVSSEEGEHVKRPTTVIQSINPDSVNIYQVPVNSHSQSRGVPDTGGGKGPGGGGDTPKVAAPDKEKEAATDIQGTTSSWLNATFELKKKSKVNQVELFSDYLQFCRKFGISNALSSADFLQLVKATFHQCEVLSINRKNGDRDVYFEGLCKRPAQKPFAVTTLPPEKVRKPLCVNVSPKQSPCQVLDPLAHTPTLRQRLMEPPRVSIHSQLPHTAALSPTVSLTPSQAATKSKNHQNLTSTPLGTKKGTGVMHTKVVQANRVQGGRPPTPVKRVVSAANTSGTDSLSLSPVVVGGQQLAVLKAQNSTNTLHNLNSGTAHSFPSITHALQAEQVSRLDSSDLLSVKSLLAKKLSHTIPEQDSATSLGPNYHSSNIGILQPGVSTSLGNISVQISQANVIVSSTAGSVGHSSSQATTYQHYHPVTVSSVMSSAPTFVASSAAMSNSSMKLTQNFTTSDINNANSQNSISLVPAAQNSTSLNQLAINHSVMENSFNNSAVQQSSNLNNVIAHHSNISSSSVVPNPIVSFIQRNNNSYIQNAQISVVQQNTLHPSGSQPGNISIVPQQQNSVGVHLVQQNAATETALPVVPQNSVTIVQQQNIPAAQNSSIPCAILPKNAGHQQSNSMAAGAVTSQSSTFSTQLTSATVNHSIRNQSTVRVANHQTGRTLNSSNAITLSAPVQGASVTQPVSSSAVAALLTTSSQSGSQMIFSTPVIAGQVQRPQAISGQAPTTVVIQTPPGTIVMPSRQVVVQGGGPTAFGSVQQGSQGGTVSFIVPSQYRPGSSVTVQGLNFIQQQGSVNVMPSLALANSTAQSQTQNIIQAAQTQQNLMQAAQNQQNLIQTGTRQIVLASGQTKTLPVGVQISSLPGNFVRNTSNLCMAPQDQQPQQNIIIQSSSIQPLPQTMSAAGVTVNMSQGQPSITSVQLPLHSAESQLVRSELHLNNQQQQQPQQQLVSQTLNISPLVVMDTQQQQTLLSNQCNGLNHDVNGILGSPESVGSDFPPSPLSFGLVSDKDVLNGKLIDLDRDSLVKKHDIEKVCEKIKMNGYIHTVDSSTLDLLKAGQSESQNTRVLSHGLNAESQGVIVNGCVSGVMQGAHSAGHRVNIPTAQGVANPGINNGGIIQIQAHAGHLVQQHGIPQQVVSGAGQQVTAGLNQKVVGYVQQQQLQFQPQQLHLHLQQQHLTMSQQPTQQLHIQPHQQIIQQQQQQHTQVHVHTQFQQGQRLQLQRPQQPGTANTQQLSNIQLQSRNLQQSTQQRPRISTLPCQPPGSQVGSTLNRPVLSRDISGDSDISSDSVTSVTDTDKPVVNGQATQTLVVTPATSKAKFKSKKMEGTPVTEKLQPKARSKKKGSSAEGSIAVQAVPQNYVHKPIQMEYMCEWTSCRRCFSSARLVFLHVFKQHLPKTAESSCQWTSCEKLIRKRWSLVSHMQDHHCSESAMRAAFQRRLASAQQQSNVSTPAPHQPMIYPPDAAMQAIRRFSIKQPYAEFAEQREGPVSKHIRLTAALILRNICHFSTVGRRLVKRHEQDLSYNMMNAVEASTALSHCLWEIVHCCEQSSGPLKI